MRTKEAVAQRILELCRERNIAVNALANISGVSPSTIYSMLNQKSQNPGVVSIKKLCDGFEITVREFFDSPLFDETEQKIKQNELSDKFRVAQSLRYKDNNDYHSTRCLSFLIISYHHTFSGMFLLLTIIKLSLSRLFLATSISVSLKSSTG